MAAAHPAHPLILSENKRVLFDALFFLSGDSYNILLPAVSLT